MKLKGFQNITQSIFSKKAHPDFFNVHSIQPKLTINQPNDPYEKEADAMADKVVQRSTSPFFDKETNAASFFRKPNPALQRKCASCEKEEEKVQKKPESSPAQSPAANIESSLNSSKGTGSPLPTATRLQMEDSFGADFSNVKIHTGTSAAEMNKGLNAQAFTNGSDIYFNSGKYDTNSNTGKHLLAHELTHVVQQNSNLVSSSSSKSNVRVQRSMWDDINAEWEKKRQEQEKAAVEQFLNQNMPECIRSGQDAATSAQKFLAGENIDKSNLVILRERFDFFNKEYNKIELWLTKKADLSPDDKAKLESDKEKIVQLFRTPLSLNPQIDVTKFSIEEMEIELTRINEWVQKNPVIPENSSIRHNYQKLMLLYQMHQDPPVFWGRDQKTMKRYLNVKAPGHALGEIAFYLYGDATKTTSITNMDGSPAPDFIGIGHSVTFDESSVPSMTVLAQSAKIQLKAGPEDLNTDGQNEALTSVVLADKTYLVTTTQLRVLLTSMFNTERQLYKIELDFLKDQFKVYTDHKEDTNWAIRTYSDTLGGASFDADYYSYRIRQCTQYYDSIKQFSEIAVTPDIANDLHRRLSFLRGNGKLITRELMQYMNDTVEGAGSAIHALEVTRNVSFGIVAGLAGAVVAPIAFGAAASVLGTGTFATVAAGGIAVAGGAEVGAAIQGSLNVVAPGAEADLSASDRFWSGAKKGAVSGGLGAGGALASQGVSGAIASKLFGAGAELTAAQQTVVNVLTGASIGAPSGVISGAIENFNDWHNGKITLWDYVKKCAWSGATGTVMGGAFSLLPIKGLYRSGGEPFNPFSGEPVLPRFMLQGPWSPLQAKWSPPPEFNALNAGELPRLPDGYAWARIGNQWEPISMNGPFGEPLTLQTYTDANGNMNYNLLRGSKQLSSFADTRNSTYKGPRQYPMTPADYAEANGTAWIRGHNVDHADTIDFPGTINSTSDPLNYTPEPGWWGMGPRNTLVARARANGGSYRQMNYYSSSPQVTNNNTPIPDGVFFVTYDAAGLPTAAYRVPFTASGPRTIDAFLGANYQIPISSLPPVLTTAAPVSINAGASVGGSNK